MSLKCSLLLLPWIVSLVACATTDARVVPQAAPHDSDAPTRATDEAPASAPLPELERVEALIAAGDADSARTALAEWAAGDLGAFLRGLDDERGIAAALEVDALAQQLALIEVQLVVREHAHALQERLLPADHPDLLSTKQDLAAARHALGDLAGAHALFEEVHTVRERLLPADHPELLRVKHNLAALRHAVGDLAGALALREHVHAARERLLPADHPDLLAAKLALAVTRGELGDLAGALALEEYVHSSRERLLPLDDLDLLATKLNLAATRQDLGDLNGALALLQHVHAAWERLLPAEDPFLLMAKQNLAVALVASGDFESAHTLFEYVHAVRERILPEGHPDLLAAKMNLAGTCKDFGDHARALALDEYVVAARERDLPADHPDLLAAKQNLAVSLKTLGDLHGALLLEEHVFAAYERLLPADHGDFLRVKSSLAATRYMLGETRAAHTAFEELHATRERLLPADHPDLLVAKARLAATSSSLGDLETARALLEEVHTATERLLPKDHPDLMRAKQSLAVILAQCGDVHGALELEEHVLASLERLLPADHPDILEARFSVASTRRALGDLAGVRTATESLLGLQSGLAAAIMTRASRQARSIALNETARLSWFACWSETLASAGFEALDRELVSALESLRLASVASGDVARAAFDVPELRATLDELARVRRALADTSFATPGDVAKIEAWRTELLALADQRDALERKVRLELQARGLVVTPPSAASIAAGLDEDAVYVGFWLYKRYSETSPPSRNLVATDALLAFVLTRDRMVRRVELGPVAALDALVATWRAALGTPIERGIGVHASDEGAELAAGRALRAALLDPILAALGDTPSRTLHVVPDDLVYLVPLDALPFDDGARLGERIAVRVDPSVARLVRSRRDTPSVGTLVAFGGVDYGAADVTPAEHLVATATPPMKRGGVRSNFEPLISSRFEAEYAAALFEEHTGGAPELRVRERANEAELTELAPVARYLHIATHGWFAPESAAVSMLDGVGEQASNALRLSVDRAQNTIVGFLPETLCGIALAGANNGPEGILTAEELATLDLSNCELAVLSACETNVGIRRAGQGIQSLQTALHAAGARTAITSLWKVDDAATRRLFELFYTKLWSDKLGPADALWQAKLALRSEGHPTRDWAGWVLTGDPD